MARQRRGLVEDVRTEPERGNKERLHLLVPGGRGYVDDRLPRHPFHQRALGVYSEVRRQPEVLSDVGRTQAYGVAATGIPFGPR